MAGIEDYYSAVAEEKRRLDAVHYSGFLFMTSLRNLQKNSTAGCVCECSTKQAAKHLVDGTARESTPEEVSAFKRAGELFAAKCAAENEKRNPVLGRVILMPDSSRGGSK